tara:strand:- start:134 stop:1090 length:957 start_codon:yes stop_codon:yes gene_type:complete
MNILITGCAGFIGSALALKILSCDKTSRVIGLDNLNNFYSPKLKKKRLSFLKKYKNFKFYKIDLLEKNKLKKLFKDNKIDMIFHFAAQAGVRYVKTYPEKFIESNIYGFHNILNISKLYKIRKFFYASSSSVYGDNNKFPVNEKSNLHPKNIYGLTKKMNEEYINIFNNQKTNYIGLRFFTVFGEWGRPDMLILKFLKHAEKNKNFFLNNSGKHWRDFTYITDVVNILYKLKSKKINSNKIYNICSNRPIFIKNLINFLIKKTNFDKIYNVKHDDIEAFKTHGKNSVIIKKTGFKKFSDFYKSVDTTINWYKKYKYLI